MARIRKNISLEEDVVAKAQLKADKMFAGNFSIYLTWLINQDNEGVEVPPVTITKTESKESKLDKEVKNSLDDILEQ